MVLTQKDYKKEIEKTVPTHKTVGAVKTKVSKKIWRYRYPEIEIGQSKNFEDYWIIDGEKIHVLCENGIVETSNEKLHLFLKENYVFLEEKNV